MDDDTPMETMRTVAFRCPAWIAAAVQALASERGATIQQTYQDLLSTALESIRRSR